MKTFGKIKYLAVGLMAAAAMASCDSLGFGLDVDSGGVTPYWYGGGSLSDVGWDGGWGGNPWYGSPWYDGPWYNSPGPLPVLRPGGPGPVGWPRPPRPQLRPPMNVPSQPSTPVVTLPSGAGRPGNMGRPTPSVSVDQLNLNRGRGH